MIKLFRFARRDPALTARVFETAWWREATRAAEAPPEVRPVRVVVGSVLPTLSSPADQLDQTTDQPDQIGGPDEGGPSPRHDAISVLWFTDTAALGRFEAWLATAAGSDGSGSGPGPGPGPGGSSSSAVGPGSAARASSTLVSSALASSTLVTVVAEERVARGADWLDRHLADGGGAFKHLALARRTSGLTRAEFSKRWAAHGGQGRVVGTATATAIPVEVRGDAYVQNHPLPADGDPSYDAVNEVYFAELGGLRARARWFQANPLDSSGADLFGPTTFLAVREEVLLAGVPADAG